MRCIPAVPTIQREHVYVEYVVRHTSLYILLLKTCFNYIPSPMFRLLHSAICRVELRVCYTYYIPRHMFRLLHSAIFRVELRVLYAIVYLQNSQDLILPNEHTALQYKMQELRKLVLRSKLLMWDKYMRNQKIFNWKYSWWSLLGIFYFNLTAASSMYFRSVIPTNYSPYYIESFKQLTPLNYTSVWFPCHLVSCRWFLFSVKIRHKVYISCRIAALTIVYIPDPHWSRRLFIFNICAHVTQNWYYVCFVLCMLSHCVVLWIVCVCVLDYCQRDIGALFDYPNWGFSLLFPQL
jgi:hypothetical protein